MAPDPNTFRCSYHVSYEADSDPEAVVGDDVLAHIRFGSALRLHSDPRRINVALPQLSTAPLAEVWRSRCPVVRGHDHDVVYACNGDVLFGQLRLDGPELADLDHATTHAYRRIEALMQGQGYPYPLRMWNFVPHINYGRGDAERYRLFSQGRFNSLASKAGFETVLPAATAIGTREQGVTLYFLAAREPGEQVENPRQVSAFHYPPVYGPTSPSFSRAYLKHWADGIHLFVSGTASVVGHRSLHPRDPLAQLDETHRNIAALLERAAELKPTAGPFHTAALKMYVRNAEDWPLLLPRVQSLFGRDTPLLALAGDICRRDLLLEIEGLYTASPRQAAA